MGKNKCDHIIATTIISDEGKVSLTVEDCEEFEQEGRWNEMDYCFNFCSKCGVKLDEKEI